MISARLWPEVEPQVVTQSLADRIAGMRRALRAEELAELLAVSKISIYKAARTGRIPSFNIGTSVRFDPAAVGKWLRTQ